MSADTLPNFRKVVQAPEGWSYDQLKIVYYVWSPDQIADVGHVVIDMTADDGTDVVTAVCNAALERWNEDHDDRWRIPPLETPIRNGEAEFDSLVGYFTGIIAAKHREATS